MGEYKNKESDNCWRAILARHQVKRQKIFQKTQTSLIDISGLVFKFCGSLFFLFILFFIFVCVCVLPLSSFDWFLMSAICLATRSFQQPRHNTHTHTHPHIRH
jgi:hypothetical protein